MTDGQKIMVKFIVVLEAIQYYSPIILKRYVLITLEEQNIRPPEIDLELLKIII